MNHSTFFRRSRGGFTLVEMIIVIGIVVLLAAIALPALTAARKSAKVSQIKSQLRMIETALVAYEQDFKALPPGQVGGADSIGFAMLGITIVGPGGATPQQGGLVKGGPATYQERYAFNSGDIYGVTVGNGITEYICIAPTAVPAPNATYWRALPPKIYSDGKDGFGLKTPDAKSWGPYLQPDKLKMQGAAILDLEGNPILYIPARTAKNNVREPIPTASGNIGSYVAMPPANSSAQPQYNAAYAWASFVRSYNGEVITNQQHVLNGIKRMQLLMGAYPHDSQTKPGCLNPAKEPVDHPYLLWSAGLDGKYGPELDPDPGDQQKLVDKCDDVTNFR